MNGWVVPQLAMLTLEEYLQHQPLGQVERLRAALSSGQELTQIVSPLEKQIAEKDEQIAKLTEECNRLKERLPRAAE